VNQIFLELLKYYQVHVTIRDLCNDYVLIIIWGPRVSKCPSMTDTGVLGFLKLKNLKFQGGRIHPLNLQVFNHSFKAYENYK